MLDVTCQAWWELHELAGDGKFRIVAFSNGNILAGGWIAHNLGKVAGLYGHVHISRALSGITTTATDTNCYQLYSCIELVRGRPCTT